MKPLLVQISFLFRRGPAMPFFRDNSHLFHHFLTMRLRMNLSPEVWIPHWENLLTKSRLSDPGLDDLLPLLKAFGAVGSLIVIF